MKSCKNTRLFLLFSSGDSVGVSWANRPFRVWTVTSGIGRGSILSLHSTSMARRCCASFVSIFYARAAIPPASRSGGPGAETPGPPCSAASLRGFPPTLLLWGHVPPSSARNERDALLTDNNLHIRREQIARLRRLGKRKPVWNQLNADCVQNPVFGREAREMARKAMVFFLTLCCLMLGWAALAMGEKLDGQGSGAPSIRAGYGWQGDTPCSQW